MTLREIRSEIEGLAKGAQADMRAVTPETRDYYMGRADAYCSVLDRLDACLASPDEAPHSMCPRCKILPSATGPDTYCAECLPAVTKNVRPAGTTDASVQKLLRSLGHTGDAYNLEHCRMMGLGMRFSVDELLQIIRHSCGV